MTCRRYIRLGFLSVQTTNPQVESVNARGFLCVVWYEVHVPPAYVGIRKK